MKTSNAQMAANRRYLKQLQRYLLICKKGRDDDVIEALAAAGNKSELMREAIRAYTGKGAAR